MSNGQKYPPKQFTFSGSGIQCAYNEEDKNYTCKGNITVSGFSSQNSSSVMGEIANAVEKEPQLRETSDMGKIAEDEASIVTHDP